MTRARILADYVSSGVTAAEFDFLDTTSGTPGSGNFLRGDKTWAEAGGGKIVQVGDVTVGNTATTTSDATTEGAAASTGITDSINFTLGNKIWCLCVCSTTAYGGGSDSGGWAFLHDGSNRIGADVKTYIYSPATNFSGEYHSTAYMSHLFSPSGTSVTVTLKIYAGNGATNKCYHTHSSIQLIEVAA